MRVRVQPILPLASSRARAQRADEKTSENTPNLTFQADSWPNKFRRLRRRLLTASSPSNSISNRSGSVADGSDPSHQQQLQDEQARHDERAHEDEQGEWHTEKIVIGANDHSETKHDDKSSTQTHTGPHLPSEFDDEADRRDLNASNLFVRLKNRVLHFFDPVFYEPASEEQFQKEKWFNTKPLAVAASGFMVLNWILYLVFNHSITLYEKIAYYGVATFLTLPLPLLVGFDLPRHHSHFFQLWLMCATWFWGVSEVIQTKSCHFFTTRSCNGKDFLFMMTYSIALPALVLFSCAQKRGYAALGTLVQFLLLTVLVTPVQGIFARNIVSFVIFSAFFIFLHYWQEIVDRKLFVLRAQLRTAYKVGIKAQQAQRQAAESKRRFVSYIFHEVRVPLNSAMLAFQNIQASESFKVVQKSLAVEIHALEGSMSAMKQVLDDVLDLQRMDAGRFENSPLPFPFHRTIESLLGPLRVATAAKGLELVIELDKQIDNWALKAGQITEISDRTSEDGQHTHSEGVWLIGDALRLRQVMTNFASNAVKFTPQGAGPISVKTILVSSHQSTPLPSVKENFRTPVEDKTIPSSKLIFPDTVAMDRINAQSPSHSIVIRIEVSDSGPGIRPSDAKQLFEPFVQTKLGVAQAGGSGLGLAIVRQIVSLNGGRLGFQSTRNKGSTFWVEFKYDIATRSEIQQQLNSQSTAIWTEPSLMERQQQLTFSSTLGAAVSAHSLTTTVVPDTMISLHPPFVKFHSSPDPLTTQKANLKDESSSKPELLGQTTDPPLQVLVVDDDPLTRALMTRILERLGAQVSTANDGRQALDILLGEDGSAEEHSKGNTNRGKKTAEPRYFDMVSLDNSMPVMTGMQAVKTLRECGRNDFVVGATGNALQSDQVAYLNAGADQVLSKPLMVRDLKAVLQLALERRIQRAKALSSSPPELKQPEHDRTQNPSPEPRMPP